MWGNYIKDCSSIETKKFPIICSINDEIDIKERPRHEKWDFTKAGGQQCEEICWLSSDLTVMKDDIEECESEVSQLILNAALSRKPLKTVGGKRKMVPWWNDNVQKW